MTIEELSPTLDNGYAAMDNDGTWNWYEHYPDYVDGKDGLGFWFDPQGTAKPLSDNIEHFKGDWKQSVVKCGYQTMHNGLFLEKYLYFKDLLDIASIRSELSPEFTSKSEYFCKMVIRLSKIVAGPDFEDLTIENLCGVIKDENESNRYYYMRDFKLKGNKVLMELYQHKNGNFPVIYTLEIDRKHFNEYLNFVMAYVDGEVYQGL